jgi:hypothetical protein
MLPQKNGAVNPKRCSRYRISTTVHPPCQRNHPPSAPLRHNTRDRGCHRPVAKADPYTPVARNTCAKAENGQPIKYRRPSSSVTLGALSNSWIKVITFLVVDLCDSHCQMTCRADTIVELWGTITSPKVSSRQTVVTSATLVAPAFCPCLSTPKLEIWSMGISGS